MSVSFGMKNQYRWVLSHDHRKGHLIKMHSLHCIHYENFYHRENIQFKACAHSGYWHPLIGLIKSPNSSINALYNESQAVLTHMLSGHRKDWPSHCLRRLKVPQ